jgi:hypothetical protein
MTVEHLNGDAPQQTLATQGTGAFETSVDFDGDEPPSRSVIRAIEAATGTDALDLPPLHGAVDTEALDAIVLSAGVDARVSFEYASLGVTVFGNGDIRITDVEAV